MLKKLTVSAGRLADDTDYLMVLNENLGREVNHLHEEIRELRTLNKELLKKLGILERIKIDKIEGNLEPIGGFKTLRTRIAEAEAESRKEFNRLNENANKQIFQGSRERGDE